MSKLKIIISILFLFIGIYVQAENPYSKQWKKVKYLENHGLSRSSLEIVNEIYALSKAANNDEQVIKCLIYKAKYNIKLELNGAKKAIKEIHDEIEISQFPRADILSSVLAEMYGLFLDEFRYKLQNRTKIKDGNLPSDILLWTENDFRVQQEKYYMKSIQNKEMLMNVSMDNFIDILTNNKIVLRPNLYDFLGHRVIDFYSNSRYFASKPKDKYYIIHDEAFADATIFSNFNFESKYKNSPRWNILQVLQNLTKFHLKDDNPAALIDVELKRLRWVYSKALHDDKGDRYLKALEKLRDKYVDVPSSTEIIYKIAHYYTHTLARLYKKNSGDDRHRYDIKIAYDFCENAVDKFPKSYGAELCKELMGTIKARDISLKFEAINPANHFSLMSVDMKNVSNIYFRIVKVTKEQETIYKTLDERKKGEFLIFLESTHSWMEKMPVYTDYRAHLMEIKIPKLPYGRYVIIASDSKYFYSKNTAVTSIWTTISDIAYFVMNDSKYVVVDRVTGFPKPNVKVNIYQKKYSSACHCYYKKYVSSRKSDKYGFFTLKGKGATRNPTLEFSKGADNFVVDDNDYVHRYNEHGEKRTHIFLDRAIYRPGQTIYFKGILIKKSDFRSPKIMKHQKVKISFFNRNRKLVSSLDLISNEYGSVSGSFIAPSGVLLGRMKIISDFGETTKYLQVEEYKRPKFEVKFEPTDSSYVFGDSISIKGHGLAFSGNKLDGAEVTYRVVREVSYPYWRYRSRQKLEMEIDNGDTVADENGDFDIRFLATPDLDIPKKRKPIFTYKIYVDVIDLNGETHSKSTTVAVGYVALKVKLDVPDNIASDDFTQFKISSKNLNNQFEGTKGHLTMTALKTPKQTFKKRYWTKPDTLLISKLDFNEMFPYFAYAKEDQPEFWEKENVVLNIDFDTKQSSIIPIVNTLIPGKYRIHLKCKDRFGVDIELDKIITIFDLGKKDIPTNEWSWKMMNQSTFEPGESAKIWYGSQLKRPFLLTIEKHAKIVKQKWMTVEGLKKISIPVKKKDRGNFYVSITSVLNNRLDNQTQTIIVPFSNKVLDFEYASFRNKLEPGAEETWQIKISGHKKDKISAEMVATLYDASLDQFAVNQWSMNLYQNFGKLNYFKSKAFFTENSKDLMRHSQYYKRKYQKEYAKLNWFGLDFEDDIWIQVGDVDYDLNLDGIVVNAYKIPVIEKVNTTQGKVVSSEDIRNIATKSLAGVAATTAGLGSADDGANLDVKGSRSSSTVYYIDGMAVRSTPLEKAPKLKIDTPIQIRKNLKETVFFFPHLKTDKHGNFILNFTMNEALTKWRFLGLAHTKDLKVGTTTAYVQTQKQLMVVPNPPRFFREGDEIEFPVKINNLTSNDLSGVTKMEFFNAVTMENIDHLLQNDSPNQSFSVKSGQSTVAVWKLKMPKGNPMAITYRAVAQSGQYSDGEENALPMLTNRILLTETLPLAVRENSEKTFHFNKMANYQSATMSNHKFTLEYTSNPAWNAIQAMPYVMEYKHECTEQTFNRYFVNSLGASLMEKYPKIKKVFDKWKNTDAILSNLAKNQELKSILLEETPWVLAAENESKQKKRLATLFDLNKMSKQMDAAFTIIENRQLADGGFSWYGGRNADPYMTRYLVEGFGHLNRLKSNQLTPREKKMLSKALKHIDRALVRNYERLKERNHIDMEENHLSWGAIHYLYARSFFLDVAISESTQEVIDYYLRQGEKYWVKQNIYMQGMLALAFHRFGNHDSLCRNMIQSFKEKSIYEEELGMYFKYRRGYYWYQLPIESHALMIEVFDEIAKDEKAVNDMKIWLLKHKQVNRWSTTKSTAASIYVLLTTGKDWLNEDAPVEISLGNGQYDDQIKEAQSKADAGTGYFKTAWSKADISKDMSKITVKNPNSMPTYGSVYWQYFEDLDHVTIFEETPLKLKKALYKVVNTDFGQELDSLDQNTILHPGDQVKVRIELQVDRDMQYIHMKDMRASGFEPMNVISRYKRQGALGYYESTGDVATNFFFTRLPKGTYVFEYPLRVVHKGDFSNGVSMIQSMYAPEFSSHSEGIRVRVIN